MPKVLIYRADFLLAGDDLLASSGNWAGVDGRECGTDAAGDPVAWRKSDMKITMTKIWLMVGMVAVLGIAQAAYQDGSSELPATAQSMVQAQPVNR